MSVVHKVESSDLSGFLVHVQMHVSEFFINIITSTRTPPYASSVRHQGFKVNNQAKNIGLQCKNTLQPKQVNWYQATHVN